MWATGTSITWVRSDSVGNDGRTRTTSNKEHMHCHWRRDPTATLPTTSHLLVRCPIALGSVAGIASLLEKKFSFLFRHPPAVHVTHQINLHAWVHVGAEGDKAEGDAVKHHLVIIPVSSLHPLRRHR